METYLTRLLPVLIYLYESLRGCHQSDILYYPCISSSSISTPRMRFVAAASMSAFVRRTPLGCVAVTCVKCVSASVCLFSERRTAGVR